MWNPKIKLTDATTYSPAKSKDDGHYLIPRKLTDADPTRSMASHRSRFTASSKLTNSKLFSTLSRTNLLSKKEEEKKERDLQIEILNNTMEALQQS